MLMRVIKKAVLSSIIVSLMVFTDFVQADDWLSSVKSLFSRTSKLDKLFNREMLGVQLPYFESIAGTAMNVYENSRSYKIDECHVGVRVDKNNNVRSIRLESISEQCTFDLSKFLGESSPWQVSTITFGDLEKRASHSGNYQMSCYGDCGNAADPMVFRHYEYPHSDAFIEVNAEVVLAVADALTAAEIWENAIRAAEPDVLKAEPYYCGKGLDNVAGKAFQKVKISS